jgi:hypothetical protein
VSREYVGIIYTIIMMMMMNKKFFNKGQVETKLEMKGRKMS